MWQLWSPGYAGQRQKLGNGYGPPVCQLAVVQLLAAM